MFAKFRVNKKYAHKYKCLSNFKEIKSMLIICTNVFIYEETSFKVCIRISTNLFHKEIFLIFSNHITISLIKKLYLQC